MQILGRILLGIAPIIFASSNNVWGQTAENYPQRLIRLVIGSAPGGATDIVGRIVASKLSEELGQSIVIDNRAGASGNIGVEVAARSNPDGYTLLQGNVGYMAINPIFNPKSFMVVPLRDFIPVTQVVDIPSLMIITPTLPTRSLKEFIDYARANPDKLNVSSGAANILDIESFKRAAGIKMVTVQYKGGAGPLITGLLTNEISVAFTSLSSSIGMAKAGTLPALAIISTKRWSTLPDVPTFTEAGMPGMTTGQWQGIFVPAGTSRSIVNKLFSSTVKVMGHPDVKERITTGAAEVVVSKSPEEFLVFFKSESVRLAKVAKDAGLSSLQ